MLPGREAQRNRIHNIRHGAISVDEEVCQLTDLGKLPFSGVPVGACEVGRLARAPAIQATPPEILGGVEERYAQVSGRDQAAELVDCSRVADAVNDQPAARGVVRAREDSTAQRREAFSDELRA